MPPRFFIDLPLPAGDTITLSSAAARHIQVLRLQPGSPITLFNGDGGEWAASVVRIGRNEVQVQIGEHHAADRELNVHVTLAVGMPANERMDGLVEKATELGVAVVQPLMCERSVLRLAGERALKKVAHWQAVAQAACEQSGRTRVPRIEPVRTLPEWLGTLPPSAGQVRCVLSLRDAQVFVMPAHGDALLSLSGPEGGLSEAEEALARARGFVAVSLGTRVLRADTAPLALLAHVAVREGLGF